MGLFGKILSKFNEDSPETGLSIADRLGGWGSDWSPAELQSFGRGKLETSRLGSVRERLLNAIDKAYAPQYPVAQSIDPSLVGSPDQPMQPEPQDPMQALMPELLRAQAAGLNIGNPQAILKMNMPEYETINGGDGSYGVVDKRTGKVSPGQLPNQYAELLAKLKQAQIEAAEALAAQRQSASGLNNAKTRAGGFAPRQPRAGPKTLPPLPSGFVVSQ